MVVARDDTRLAALAKELHATHGVAVEVCTADLTRPGDVGAVETLLASSESPVDLLVNNAGIATTGAFADLPIEAELAEIDLNVIALVRLCRAALPGMIRRGAGGIINVSSLAGYQPTPKNATYAATKAYVTSFSQALREEVRGTGTHVMVVCPGMTRTEFQARAQIDSSRVPARLWMEAETVVEVALRGFERERAVCIPGALNQAAAAFSATAPAVLTRRIAGAVVDRVE